ncbi:TetR family transcriptional regulator [Mycobacterium gordonae]|uniref:TetR family transcriptional regulator n=1 Tax=Mycobacterium gordonae TaxID=1778 RepID=A0A0Q2LY27_MYCGO|nr:MULTISPECIES: TetR/AcrR family transcriptional regulator [Mycobacterium]KQH80546.1 TetR family transcriptional regulator [Mycobacterium gordonae]MDP7729673.1 TetR/AcrR family transcriptional regulator [Mycobacterium sp. TY813]
MARYTAEHKGETRKRILETAGRRFKRDGIDGSGIAAIMSDAQLTNGAFYAHFKSKDDLVANVVAEQMRGWQANLPSSPDRAGLEAFVREYLSPQHRDNPETGCPNAALLDEIGRCGKATRRSYTQAMQNVVDEVAARLSPGDPSSARSDAIGLFTILVATLQLARAVTDRAFSDDILESGISNAQILLDRTQHPPSTHSRKRSR